MITCKTRPSNGVGETSSKYGYSNGGDLFEQDVARHFAEYESLWQEFVTWMKSKDVDPRKFRCMFTRYYKEFIEGDQK